MIKKLFFKFYDKYIIERIMKCVNLSINYFIDIKYKKDKGYVYIYYNYKESYKQLKNDRYLCQFSVNELLNTEVQEISKEIEKRLKKEFKDDK